MTFNKGYDNECKVKFNINDDKIEQKNLFLNDQAETKSPIINIVEEAYTLKLILEQLKEKQYDNLTDKQKGIYDKTIEFINGDTILDLKDKDDIGSLSPLPPKSNGKEEMQLKPPLPPIPNGKEEMQLKSPLPPIPDLPTININSEEDNLMKLLRNLNLIEIPVKNANITFGNDFIQLVSGGQPADVLTSIMAKPASMYYRNSSFEENVVGLSFDQNSYSVFSDGGVYGDDVVSLINKIKKDPQNIQNFSNPYNDLIVEHAYGILGSIDNTLIEDSQPWNFIQNINPHNNKVIHYNKQDDITLLHKLKLVTDTVL